MAQTISPELVAARIDRPLVEIEDFDRVVEAYWPRVFRFVLASLRDRDAAETLTQDCFMRAYKARKHFRGEASVNTWLMRIAVNLVRDAARNRKLQFWKRTRSGAVDPAEILDCIPDQGASPEGVALMREQVAAVWSATEALPERQRTVFLLRFVEDMDLLEIANVTGISVGAVKVHLFRALHAVRKSVGRLR